MNYIEDGARENPLFIDGDIAAQCHEDCRIQPEGPANDPMLPTSLAYDRWEDLDGIDTYPGGSDQREMDEEEMQVGEDWYTPENEHDDMLEDVDVDKCLCCGKWKASESLSYPDQTCITGCTNPAEY